MPINSITQTISELPAAGRRGVDVQTQFVIKQEDFQDHLQGITVVELNTFKDQLNTRIGEINSTTTTMNEYATSASSSASTATTKAGEAATSASGALTSRNQAETFKNNASTSASTATTKASEASASALSASTSASTATTKAGEASASASTATTKASEASASASSASTSASTATTKAGEASASALSASTSASTATTKASEASASASQALTSRNQAETFAQQASASALSVDVNNLVHRTGDETIAGIKTFSSNIVGNITGNSGTATNASNLGGKAPGYYQQALGFTPIQQGGGASQGPNKIFIGWQGPYLRCQVDASDFGTTFPMNITGNSGTATTAADSSKLIGRNWYWSGQGGQPAWLWGGSDGANMYVYNPSNFNVNTAVSLSTAVGSAPSYACRAWVNFNGTGTVAIRASGNVSSITDNGVGSYAVNFSVPMPDANYCVNFSGSNVWGGNNMCYSVATMGGVEALPTTTSINVTSINQNGSLGDSKYSMVSIFR